MVVGRVSCNRGLRPGMLPGLKVSGRVSLPWSAWHQPSSWPCVSGMPSSSCITSLERPAIRALSASAATLCRWTNSLGQVPIPIVPGWSESEIATSGVSGNQVPCPLSGSITVTPWEPMMNSGPVVPVTAAGPATLSTAPWKALNCYTAIPRPSWTSDSAH